MDNLIKGLVIIGIIIISILLIKLTDKIKRFNRKRMLKKEGFLYINYPKFIKKPSDYFNKANISKTLREVNILGPNQEIGKYDYLEGLYDDNGTFSSLTIYFNRSDSLENITLDKAIDNFKSILVQMAEDPYSHIEIERSEDLRRPFVTYKFYTDYKEIEEVDEDIINNEEKEKNLNRLIKWHPRYIGDSIENVPIGFDGDKSLVNLRITGGHTLLVGATGAGKGSVLWTIIGTLVHNEKAELWGADLKDGLEFSMNPDIFKSLATNYHELNKQMTSLLEEMQSRASYMKENRIRKWQATKLRPNIYLFVDEVNAIPSILKTVTKQESADFMMKWNTILQQGRAAGIAIFAAGQSQNYNSIPSRDLFTNRIILRAANENQQRNFMGAESVHYAQTWRYKQGGVYAGRGLLYDNELGTYNEFKAIYPNDEDIKGWVKF